MKALLLVLAFALTPFSDRSAFANGAPGSIPTSTLTSTSTPTPTVTSTNSLHCGGIGQCTVDGTGIPCTNGDECGKNCSTDGKCILGNPNGNACRSESDCASEEKVCLIGQSKCGNPAGSNNSENIPCTDNSQCQNIYRCTADGKCSTSGTSIYLTCNPNKDPENPNDDCKTMEKTCSQNGQCMVGGNLTAGAGSCNSDSDCVIKPRCTPFGTCEIPFPGYTGSSLCSSATDCQEMRCSGINQCSSSGLGARCNVASDCGEDKAMTCAANGQCKVGAAGPGCTPTAKPGELGHCGYTVSTRCDSNFKCTTDGRGAPCHSSSECGQQHCGGYGQCTRAGSGPSCSSGEDCKQLRCGSLGSSCVYNGVGNICSTNAECKQVNTTKVCNTTNNTCQDNRGIPPGSGEVPCANSSDCMPKSTPTPTGLSSFSMQRNLVSSQSNQIANSEPTKTKLSARQVMSILKSGGNATSIGSAKAPVTLVMFQDLRCHMARKVFIKNFGPLEKDYIEKKLVRVEFREFPLGYAPLEVHLAQAALCAGDQGKYKDFISLVYQDMDKIDPAKPEDLILRLGIKPKSFLSCMKSQKYSKLVRRDFDLGNRLGVDGTPQFFVNGEDLPGAQPYEVFQSMIDKKLKEKGIKVSRK